MKSITVFLNMDLKIPVNVITQEKKFTDTKLTENKQL